MFNFSRRSAPIYEELALSYRVGEEMRAPRRSPNDAVISVQLISAVISVTLSKTSRFLWIQYDANVVQAPLLSIRDPHKLLSVEWTHLYVNFCDGGRGNELSEQVTDITPGKMKETRETCEGNMCDVC